MSVPRRFILAETTKHLGSSPPLYRTEWSNGSFVCTVETTVPLRCNAGCRSVLRAIGRPSPSPIHAEENAAECLIRGLRRRFGVQVNDANWSRLKRSHHRYVLIRSSMEQMMARCGDLLEKTRLLSQGWEHTLSDLRVLNDACENLCTAAAGLVDASGGPPEHAHVVFGLYCLRAWSREKLEEGLAKKMAVQASDEE